MRTPIRKVTTPRRIPTRGSQRRCPVSDPATPASTERLTRPSTRACCPSATRETDPVLLPARIRRNATASFPRNPVTLAKATHPGWRKIWGWSNFPNDRVMEKRMTAGPAPRSSHRPNPRTSRIHRNSGQWVSFGKRKKPPRAEPLSGHQRHYEPRRTTGKPSRKQKRCLSRGPLSDPESGMTRQTRGMRPHPHPGQKDAPAWNADERWTLKSPFSCEKRAKPKMGSISLHNSLMEYNIESKNLSFFSLQ